jgi:hypothetical protein
MAAKKKTETLTKEQRAARESELADQLFASFTAMTEATAREHTRKARALEKGLGAVSVARAKKLASAWAHDFPPGHLEAMGSMDLFEEICADFGVDSKDADALWGAVAQLCMFQLAAQRGSFHQAAVDFGLARPVTIASTVRDFMARDLAARDGNAICDCPNCRPRAESELN